MSTSQKQIIAVVGATGGQGSSVVSAFLKDPTYSIRAITRNPSSNIAVALSDKGVEVVQADLNSYETLVEAFKGVSVIFAVTDFFAPFAKYGPEKAIEIEEQQGINLARAASNTPTLKHYIWSTLANASRISNSKHQIPHFSGKNTIDDYIKQDKPLFEKTTFLWNSYFADNCQYPPLNPFYIESTGKYFQLSPVSPSTPISCLGDHRTNIGIFTHAIVSQPEKTLPGKFVFATVETTQIGELLKMWGEVKGKETLFVTVSLENFEKLWPGWGTELGLMFKFWEEAGEKSWSGEEGVVTAGDLGLGKESGLIGMRETLTNLK